MTSCMSARRSSSKGCRLAGLVGQHRSTQPYQPVVPDYELKLVARMNQLAQRHPATATAASTPCSSPRGGASIASASSACGALDHPICKESPHRARRLPSARPAREQPVTAWGSVFVTQGGETDKGTLGATDLESVL